MKRALGLTILSIVAATATTMFAREYATAEDMAVYYREFEEKVREGEERIAKNKADDRALKEAVFYLTSLLQDEGGMDAGGMRGEYLFAVNGLKRAYQKAEISQERATKIQEEMVREKLSAIEEDKEDNVPWRLFDVMSLFGCFPDYDALPIFKECLLSKSEYFRVWVMLVYAHIKGADAIPLIRETATKGWENEKNSETFYRLLENLSRSLKSEDKPDDAEKLTAFIMEMRQKESLGEKPKEGNKTPSQTTGATESTVPPQPPNITPNSVQNITKGIPPIEQPEETSTSKNTVLVIALAAALALGGGVIAWMKKHGKRK